MLETTATRRLVGAGRESSFLQPVCLAEASSVGRRTLEVAEKLVPGVAGSRAPLGENTRRD